MPVEWSCAIIHLSATFVKMSNDELYMHHCIELAKLGAGYVAPNPMVGAVLAYEGRVIGAGYHQLYGQAHAEVNCLNSVKEPEKPFIASSTLYVSLEPCAHYGKTPPCSNLIIENKIPRVVVGCRDPFKEVNGKGIERLQNAGVEVVQNVLENECRILNKRFFTFHIQHRPFIVLKWAQTANGKIGYSAERLLISNEYTNRLAHKWRSEEMAILAGTNTVLADDPQLNNRLWSGKNPVRLVMDVNLRLPSYLKIFDQQQRTIIFNKIKHEQDGNIFYYQITDDVNIVHQIMNACYQLRIESVLVEGGARLLQSFIDDDAWDEARIITNEKLYADEGVTAPELRNKTLLKAEHIFNDRIDYFARRYNKT